MGGSVRPVGGAEETPEWEDQFLRVDPARYGRMGAQIAKKQADIRAKRKTAANAATREDLVNNPPVSRADMAGRFGAATAARARARAAGPPTIGRPGGGPATKGGKAY